MSEGIWSASGQSPDHDPDEPRVRFLTTFLLAADADFVPELLPRQLAATFAEVLPSDGAGLSLSSGGFRVPLGAGDDTSGAAERLQFTLGEGPCLQAMRDARELRANEDDIARLWPLLYDELVRQTPYRSIASVPLRITPSVVGAIDIYFTDPAGAFTVDLGDAAALAAEAAHLLRLHSAPLQPSISEADLMVPAWTYSQSSRNRMRVWIATGVLQAQLNIPSPEAFDRLRGYAYSHEQDLDELATAIIEGTLPSESFAT
jgi:hypothetical protein